MFDNPESRRKFLTPILQILRERVVLCGRVHAETGSLEACATELEVTSGMTPERARAFVEGNRESIEQVAAAFAEAQTEPELRERLSEIEVPRRGQP